MLKKLLKNRDDERASLPAVMGASILIAATASLLAAFAISASRNSEVSISKTNLNSAITSCESTLKSLTTKTYYQDAQSGKSNLLVLTPNPSPNPNNMSLVDFAIQKCNYDSIKTQVRVLAAQNYTPNGANAPDRVQVTLQATYTGTTTETLQEVSFLPYPTLDPAQKVTASSYISGFDANGNAIWVNLSQ